MFRRGRPLLALLLAPAAVAQQPPDERVAAAAMADATVPFSDAAARSKTRVGRRVHARAARAPAREGATRPRSPRPRVPSASSRSGFARRASSARRGRDLGQRPDRATRCCERARGLAAARPRLRGSRSRPPPRPVALSSASGDRGAATRRRAPRRAHHASGAPRGLPRDLGRRPRSSAARRRRRPTGSRSSASPRSERRRSAGTSGGVHVRDQPRQRGPGVLLARLGGAAAAAARAPPAG